MRAGGSTVQQALTVEAAGIVKQAVSLARRRGHAQVTPLHVANIMLSSSAGILRAACLQSHSHPLQCKALELCFNVALNRLPASTSSVPMLGPQPSYNHHHYPPSLSNALVAAFKRAQAQQRRGSIETQQQPLLAVKIEVEQLIISILDDPSVSRVMREAGFSSTQVKNNVEQAVSLEISESSPLSPSTAAKPKANPSSLRSSTPSVKAMPADQVRQEDVKAVVDFLVSRRKRSVVIVGECSTTAEGVVKAVMDTIGKAEVPEIFGNVQFISLPLISFRCLSREEVEQKLGELRCLLKSYCAESGAILYLGDLKWAAEYSSASGGKGRSCYCPVEHVIMELGRLSSGWSGEHTSGGRFWLMGSQHIRLTSGARPGIPLWKLFGASGINGDVSSWSRIENGGENKLGCWDAPVKVEIQAKGLTNSCGSNLGSVTSSLPSWLQQYKEENRRTAASNEHIGDLCRRWNTTCSSSRKHHHLLQEKTLNFSSISPTSSSVLSYGQKQCSLLQKHKTWPVPTDGRSPWADHRGCASQSADAGSKPDPSPFSTSSGETMEADRPNSFKELNAENLKSLCHALEKKATWQKDIVPDIAATVLRCRSGMTRRKEGSNSKIREDTWLLFQGGDHEGKDRIARGLACLIFGSPASFVSFGSSSFASTRSGSSDDLRSKRPRSEASSSYTERLAEAVRKDPHSVVLVEDVEQMDYYTQINIRNAIERGKIRSSDGEEVGLSDAIIILSCESFDSRSRACSPSVKQKSESDGEKGLEGEKEKPHFKSLDLNLSADDEDEVQVWTYDEIDLLSLVDGRFFFKLNDDF
ncbi:unnamed protein product [Spirodela intermedia]|uniref:Clp R domain-containing protein n=1 Tax=Spirodela intermedia TaxID=51605 RepID=A0A7I8IRL6_SPIIN|nr:unnamed protein product [Spirodela intermedia]CAA6660613.1 unnamed protein product [Spirodela intermedia]